MFCVSFTSEHSKYNCNPGSLGKLLILKGSTDEKFRAPRSKFAVSRSGSFLAFLPACLLTDVIPALTHPCLFFQLPLGPYHMSFSEFYLLVSVHPLIHSGPTQLDFTEEKKDWGNIGKLCGYTVWSLPIFFLWALVSKHILCLNCLESVCTINSPIQAILLSVLDPGGSKLSFQHWPPPRSRTLFSRMFLLTYSSNRQPLVLLCSSP